MTTASKIVGLGAARPDRVVSAEEMGRPFAKSREWIHTRTGIRQLRRADTGAQVVGLAAAAARHALAHARTDADGIDLVIGASCSVESVAALTARELAPHALAFDVNAACSGFCYALACADGLIRTGAARRVLVVAAEHMSRFIDTEDLGTSIIFGDGAAAAVVEACAEGEPPGIGPVVWGSDGSGADLIACDLVQPNYLRMAGQKVFRWAVEAVPPLAHAACERAGVGIGDIDVLVCHQANLRIIDAVAAKIGIERAVVADDIVESGNTSAASIPLALSRLVEGTSVAEGDLALLVGFGAGLSYAAQVVRLPRCG